MKKNLHTLFFGTLLSFSMILLSGCASSKPVIGPVATSLYEEFGSIYTGQTLEMLNSKGFELGDSVDIEFDNGFKLTDIPLYDGYYCRTGEYLLCAYPTYPSAVIAHCNMSDFYREVNYTEGLPVKITLNKHGKYSIIQQTFGMKYSNDRSDYGSDVEFANFRPAECSKFAPNTIYRGATPFDPENSRPAYVQSLLRENEIKFILDLSDSEEKYLGYNTSSYDSSYTDELYSNQKIVFLSMSASFGSETFAKKLSGGLKVMIRNEGPYYIHCVEGKDRTGFVCTLLEALVGASYDEMKNDYMITYKNYYGITESSAKEKYDAVVGLKFNEFMTFLSGENNVEALPSLDYSEYAAEYLKNAGLSEDEITRLRSILTGGSNN